MSRNFLVGIFLFFLAVTATAQQPNYLKVYHPHINVAERAIIASDYLTALEAYEQAFAAVPRGFLKDYFNAAVCATYLGNADKTYANLLKVASKGVSLDFVKDEVAFSSIQQSADWRSFELKYLEEKRKAEAKIDRQYKAELAKLEEADQWFRQKNAAAFADTIAVIDARNAEKLAELIDAKGFPGEDELGCGEGGMPLIQYNFYTIMRRQAGDLQVVNFSNRLMEAARNGKILPHFATHIMATLNANDVFFARHIFQIVADNAPEFSGKDFSDRLNKWVHVAIDSEQEQTINALRLQNGMEPLAEYRQKILFSLNDHRFLFPYKVLAGMWYVADAATAASYLEGTVLAEQ